jgi:hypothetical protein
MKHNNKAIQSKYKNNFQITKKSLKILQNKTSKPINKIFGKRSRKKI